MDYELKAGEYIKGGKLYGWTGIKCPLCDGTGEGSEAGACNGCGGTGEHHGLMIVQPANLGVDTE